MIVPYINTVSYTHLPFTIPEKDNGIIFYDKYDKVWFQEGNQALTYYDPLNLSLIHIYSGMAVLLDAGMEKGIHPAKKQVAGERLALLALTKTYGVEGVNGESPYYKSIEIKNDTVVVSFERANMWISGKNCFESKNFQVAGEDKVFYPAKAWIERSKMLVKSDKVPHPVAVRYCFENYVEGDVYGDGLPLGSFRSDDW